FFIYSSHRYLPSFPTRRSSDLHGAHVHQLGRLQARLGVRRLRTIAAILGAAAGLDRQQGTKLHLSARVVSAVDALCLPHELVERQGEEFGDFLAGRVGPRLIVRLCGWGPLHGSSTLFLSC